MISHAGFLLAHVDNPQVVLGAIATAKLKTVNGRQLLVIPHAAEEVKVLKNLGLNPPPLKLDFSYTGRFKPFKHQKLTVEFLILNRRCFNLSDMGTGKTAAALWAAEYLRLKGKIKRILIVCPLSVVSVWEEECFNILPHRSIAFLTGSKERRLDKLSKGSDICVINHDGLSSLARFDKHNKVIIAPELLAAKFDLVIADEASAYRNYTTKRWKIFREFTRAMPWLWMMTGTPAPKAPTDAYGLIKLVEPTAFPGGFKLFQELTMRKLSAFKWIPREGSNEFVYKHMTPAIRFKKEDCLDLPPLTYVNRTCELTDQQNTAFKLMKKKMIMEQVSGEKITAANAAVKLLKLLQICCGVVRDNAGNHYVLDASKRLGLLEETVEEAGGKVIIFVPFIGVMNQVLQYLKDKGWNAALVNGDVSERERSRIFYEFQHGGIECLVAHPKTAAHGLNLTASATIVWYAPIFSTEQYLQANNRISRPGQHRAMTIVHMIATPLEAGIYRGLWGQVLMQQNILKLYEDILK